MTREKTVFQVLITTFFLVIHVQSLTLPGGAKLDIKLPSAERHPSRCAILIIPGGSYSGIVMKNEGLLPAKKYNEEGILAFILSYHTKTKHPVPLNDAEEAMEFIRANADKYQIDPRRIGVMGFSAGGHLAATLSTIGKEAARPDFTILFYPVISMYDSITHNTSRKNIIGSQPSDSLKALLSCYLRVTASTPPTFISHGDKDGAVPIQNSELYHAALVAADVYAVFHTERGGIHGYGGDVYKGTTWLDSYQTFFKYVMDNKTNISKSGNHLTRQRESQFQKTGWWVHGISATSYINLLGRSSSRSPIAPGIFITLSSEDR